MKAPDGIRAKNLLPLAGGLVKRYVKIITVGDEKLNIHMKAGIEL